MPPLRGTAAIREFFFGVLDAGLGDVELELLRVEIFGDIAYEAGRCKMLVPFTMGKRREERGKYLLTLARQVGDWKIFGRLLVERFEFGSQCGLAVGQAQCARPLNA